ncbi:Polysaccharide deacetylase [Anatilimnocola aggregata]|uniref:Polysaccharide deacetylase n=1 Tax=Anatilimnocola aggregata TaxID=2528021 RepID=A0A517YI53_9BACT|nr:polysaccharide deacetylase family protein [Anatilimnocola aggregata]QDU29910.1 Polysaccharide deacetylase [Anatilimnocola aggregata]
MRLILCTLSLLLFSTLVRAAETGETKVAQWNDDKRAPFILMFDDSMQGHVKTVLPELKRRNLVGTFYINAGSGHYKAQKAAWEKAFTEAGMVLANHTFTHKGAADVADLEQEIVKCNEVLYAIAEANGQPKPTLLSFGRPGVPQGKWNVTEEELKTQLRKYNLVLRQNVLFAQIHLKDAAAMIARVEKALASGKTDVVAFHGVGGEWLSIDTPSFLQLLDFIVEKRDQLWVTDPISIHKYETERESASVRTLEATKSQITLELTTNADAAIYDSPLTLITHVPADWKTVQVTQGKHTASVIAKEGKVVFDARPGKDTVVLKNR